MASSLKVQPIVRTSAERAARYCAVGDRRARAGPESWRDGVWESCLLVEPGPRDMDTSWARWSVREVPEAVLVLKEEILDNVGGFFFNLFIMMVAGSYT